MSGQRDLRALVGAAPNGIRILLVVAAVAAGGALVWLSVGELGDSADPSTPLEAAPATTGPATTAAGGDPAARETAATETTAAPSTDTTAPPTTRPPYDGLVDPASSGEPWGTEVDGLLTFRGNPTRTYYGKGPVPRNPHIAWTREIGCSNSSVGGQAKTWCGSGWTGQPSVWEHDGRTWVAFGAYDRAVHFLDAVTGVDLLPPFPTNDIIKGSVTIDPDGYPLLYTGSRDNFYRVIALDRAEPTELWKLSADDAPGRMWNDDWDGAGLILDDLLIEGGENSIFHVVKLNRSIDADGLVTVDPQLIFATPGYDAELLSVVDNNVSIENSVAVSGSVAYFANSGGLVQGWDLAPLLDGGQPERVLRYWTGDDVDASVVIDDEGYLYVGAEYERGNTRSQEVGQILKLDPRRPEDPLVWSIPDQDRRPGGIWATAAIHRDVLIVPTDGGRVLGIDRGDGSIRWTLDLPGPLWSSPVVVDDVLIQGDCAGTLHAFDVSDTTVAPPELWSVELGGCIESTPAVWNGSIHVGTRSGTFFSLRD
jgi:PQQ-like domain